MDKYSDKKPKPSKYIEAKIPTKTLNKELFNNKGLIPELKILLSKGVICNQTLDSILELSNSAYKCILCKELIQSKDEIWNCKGCFQTYHLSCTKKSLWKNKNITCSSCKNSFYTQNEPYYDCFCGKFYSITEYDLNYNPTLIPHGCGLSCDFKICEHLTCTLPCHPGNHMICNEVSKTKCACGKLVKEIDCKNDPKSMEPVSCDTKCGKKINCEGDHICAKVCHKGECYCYNNKCVLSNMKENISSVKAVNINLKGKQEAYGKSLEKVKNVVYCGRANFMGGWALKESIWQNPFKVKDYGSNEKACDEYEKYLKKNESLLSQLGSLKGKVLACWCKPDACHTDVIIKVMKEKGLEK